MTKIISLFLLIPFFSMSQETNTIKVIGQAIHIDNELNFEGSVSLSATYSSYPTEAISLKELKTKYNEALKKNGLSITNLKEDPTGYIYLRYDKDGLLYHFKTSSIDKFNNFLNSKTFGVRHLDYGYSIVISEKEASLLLAKAIKNAKNKAQLIAKAANKKLGDIVHIEDNNLINTELDQSLYYNWELGKYIYNINVTFKLM